MEKERPTLKLSTLASCPPSELLEISNVQITPISTSLNRTANSISARMTSTLTSLEAAWTRTSLSWTKEESATCSPNLIAKSASVSSHDVVRAISGKKTALASNAQLTQSQMPIWLLALSLDAWILNTLIPTVDAWIAGTWATLRTIKGRSSALDKHLFPECYPLDSASPARCSNTKQITASGAQGEATSGMTSMIKFVSPSSPHPRR